MAKGTATRTAASLVIVATSAFLFSFLRVPGPDFNPKPHQALGRVVAEEALKLLPAEGRIILFSRDAKSFKAPAAEAQLTEFCRTVLAAGRKIAVTNQLQVDPLRRISLPAGDFVERLQRATTADVVVSFLGPPILNENQLKRLGQKRLGVVAVCSGDLPRQIHLKQLFDQKLLHAAIISRPAPLPKPPPNAPWRNWFDGLFQTITATNVADLPQPSDRP